MTHKKRTVKYLIDEINASKIPDNALLFVRSIGYGYQLVFKYGNIESAIFLPIYGSENLLKFLEDK